MLGRRWAYAILGTFLFLAAGSFFSLWAVRSYLIQQVLPDLANKFQRQIQTSDIELNPLRGILIHDLEIRPLPSQTDGSEFSIGQVFLWTYPWKWVQSKKIEFYYQAEGIQKTDLAVKGSGTWNRVGQIFTLEPALEGGSLPFWISPLKTSLSYNLQSQELTAAAQTSSGLTTQLQGTKTPAGFSVSPSWIRFRDSFLEYRGDLTTAGDGGQLYLDAAGALKLDQIEEFLTAKTEIFTRIDPELSHVEFGMAVENDQVILEDLIANYALGYLSIRGVYDLSAPNRFRVSLRGDQMELGELLEEPLKKGKPIEGVIHWSATLHGDIKNIETMEGQGLFEITDGRLWDITVFKGLAKTLQIHQLERVTFHEASGRFLLKQKQWNFPQIQLRSRQLTLDGRGTVGWNGELDFLVGITFSQEFFNEIGGSPTGLIAGLLTDASGRAFTQIKITGTLKEPKYKVNPIPPQKIFQGIFQRILQ